MQPKKSQCSSLVRIFTLVALGLSFVTLATFLAKVGPSYYQEFIANQMRMTPGSHMHQAWNNSPVEVYIEFYFFNWTNSASLESDGEAHIPQLQELGPYRFKEKIVRVNVTWNDNGTLTYRQAKWWYFQPEHSNGSLTDNVTSINVVALSAANVARDWSYGMKLGISTTLTATGQTVYIHKTVGELLFDGYSDSLMDIARTMPAFAGVEVPMDKFAWFYKRNGTTFMDGVFNMNTGVEDIQKLGKLESWNYMNQTHFFPGECGKVAGTTGQMFPPGQTKENKVEMFSPDMCRSIGFDFEEETEVEGVSAYKYVGGISIVDNGTAVPEAECFCNGECVPTGVTNLTVCRYGAPAFASYPHFYLGDSFFTHSLRGLQPDKRKHQFYLTLEPITGIPLDVAARLQVNLLLQPYEGIGLYSNVPTVFFPAIWFQQRATVTPELAGSLRLLVYMRYFGVFLASLSALVACALIGYAASLWFKQSSTKTMQLMKKSDDANLYIASPVSKTQDKKGSNQYIIMKPKSALNITENN